MNKTLDQLLGLAAQQAHLVLLGLKQRSLMPSWVFIQPDGSSQILATPFGDDRQKDATVAYVKAWIKNHGTIAYSFLCEAWQTEMSTKEWDRSQPLAEAVLPRNRVDRREVVMAMATDGKATEHRQWEIVRDWQGQVVGLAPLELAESEVAPESRFAGLL